MYETLSYPPFPILIKNVVLVLGSVIDAVGFDMIYVQVSAKLLKNTPRFLINIYGQFYNNFCELTEFSDPNVSITPVFDSRFR